MTKNATEEMLARLREVLQRGLDENRYSMRELSARAKSGTNYVQQFMKGNKRNMSLEKFGLIMMALDQEEMLYVMIGQRLTETDRHLMALISSLPDSLRPNAVGILEEIAAMGQEGRDQRSNLESVQAPPISGRGTSST
ncbi:hypothetical protein ACVDG3_08720 [Meridianimarinicoccus sp. RP-17]|uniref:hypothetical protein n=1 Tax=Meridianimarinicoccus zhengii TaxID=2056810 RepID=UPI0013A696EB|nr:hypothetical protein [Phycocomes zhengii]